VVSIFIDCQMLIYRKGALLTSDFILFQKCVLHAKGKSVKCGLERDDDWNISTADGGSYTRVEDTT